MLSIPPEVGELLGREVDRRRGVVSRVDFQRWAAAVGDLNRLYFDVDFAREHGYRDVIMPPLYIGHVMTGVRRLDELRPDGSPATLGGVDIPIPHRRRMATGDTLETMAPVYGGDELTAVTRLRDVATKQGRSGPFIVVEWATRYTNQDAVVVSELTTGVILR